eukprot:7405057-Alexandrium_andersonii.AAC.1
MASSQRQAPSRSSTARAWARRSRVSPSTSLGAWIPSKSMRVGSSVGGSGPSRWTVTAGVSTS